MTLPKQKLGIALALVSGHVFPLPLVGQHLAEAVRAMEAFINNRPYHSTHSLLSVHEWNPGYHNGYAPDSKGYLLNSYPYKRAVRPTFLGRLNVIEISISPSRDMIIVDLFVNGKWYGFYSRLKKESGNTVLADVPTEAIEPD
jgi:hypothetical protein